METPGRAASKIARSGTRAGCARPMLDRWALGAIVLLAMVCLFSSYVALSVWLPDRRERARIRAERVERMLHEDVDMQMGER